jgi:hypothetical protein
MLRSSLFALALVLAPPAGATTITFQNGFGGYAGADNESYSFDGTIHQDQVRVDLPSASQPDGSYAWVIFSGLIGAGAVPEGAQILSATFEGFVRNPFDVADMTRLLADIESRPFGPGANVLDAGGEFWDNKQVVPAFHDACGDDVDCDPAVPISWDVTAIVQAWADGATNFGFLLLPETTNGGKLHATDDPNAALRPRLVIEYSSAVLSLPEPTSLALLALAATAAARARGSRAPRSPRRPGSPSR